MRKTISVSLVIAMLLILCISTVNDVRSVSQLESSKLFAPYVVYEADFEVDGDGFGGWYALGNQSELSIDDRHSRSGKTSLFVSNRQSVWSGPALNTPFLEPNETYHFECWIRHDIPEQKSILWSFKNTLKDGSEEYANIAVANVGTGGWTKVESDFTVPENANETCIYFEAEDQSLDFSIDTLVINGTKEVAEVTKEETGETAAEYHFSFEDGYEEWKPRGNPTVERTSDFSSAGQYSLYTSNRKKTWHAPMVSISQLVKTGVYYQYTAYVMYNGRQYENNHKFLLELQYNYQGQEVYYPVASKELQKGNWSKITGEYALPEGATDVYLFVQTDDPDKDAENQWLSEDDLMAFYVDDVTIEDSTYKNKRERLQKIIIISLCVLAVLFGTFMVLFIVKKLNETKDVLMTASTDTMTGALNRNSYETYIESLENNPKQCRKLYITVCDVNFLKHINDNYGHEKGDNAIKRCAAVLLKTVGKKGQVYRTGGDEFVCITRNDISGALEKALAAESQNYLGYPFAAAAGTAHYDPLADGAAPDIKNIITRSDKEMYKNKQVLKESMKKFYGIE